MSSSNVQSVTHELMRGEGGGRVEMEMVTMIGTMLGTLVLLMTAVSTLLSHPQPTLWSPLSLLLISYLDVFVIS